MSSYVGRFAPSPTGPLHIGSLTAALASYLHARQAGGEWLVRIEDIDPPRAAPGAAEQILRTLEALELNWDRKVHYQSSRLPRFAAAARSLLAGGKAFRCSCSRRDLRVSGEAGILGQRYSGRCRERPTHRGPTAIRVRVESGEVRFVDGLQGPRSHDLSRLTGDYVIFRRDDLPAYHLAVVMDDAEHGVTHVVRGSDLLEATAVHVHLQMTLGLPTPRYLHVPVLVNGAGQKLSKQTGAPGVDHLPPPETAARALGYLGLLVPAELMGAPPGVLWSWALEHWNPKAAAGTTVLPEHG